MDFLSHWRLYLGAVGAAFLISWVLTPLTRRLALRRGWMDEPGHSVKTHKTSTPVAGGIAIYVSFVATLVLLRFWTNFPTGTLYRLRALLGGATIAFLCGLADDVQKPKGLGVRAKFLLQIVAAGVLIVFGIRIRFISPRYVGWALTFLWVVGITNALNIIDVIDGLCATQAAIAAFFFLVISLPSEELYVNLASAALCGAALGFLPWNFSNRRKIFMGDSGSLTLGFVLAGISMGTDYSRVNPIGVYAPLLILLIPMYDTFFVMVLRMRKGQSPFLGSKDHFALRLEKMGYSRPKIVLLAAGAAGFLGFCASVVTQLGLGWALVIYAVLAVQFLILSAALAKVVMH